MRAALERRLADLESRGRVSREPWVIVRRIVTPDSAHAPPAQAEFRGQVLMRHEGEADDAFERRAIEAATAAAPADSVPRLLLRAVSASAMA